MIQFKCYKCGEGLEAPNSLKGQTIQCPKCQADNIVKTYPHKNIFIITAAIVVLAAVSFLIFMNLSSTASSGNAQEFLKTLQARGWKESEPPKIESVEDYKNCDSMIGYNYTFSYTYYQVTNTCKLGITVANGEIVRLQLFPTIDQEEFEAIIKAFDTSLLNEWKNIPLKSGTFSAYCDELTSPLLIGNYAVAVNFDDETRIPWTFIIRTQDYFNWENRQFNKYRSFQ